MVQDQAFPHLWVHCSDEVIQKTRTLISSSNPRLSNTRNQVGGVYPFGLNEQLLHRSPEEGESPSPEAPNSGRFHLLQEPVQAGT